MFAFLQSQSSIHIWRFHFDWMKVSLWYQLFNAQPQNLDICHRRITVSTSPIYWYFMVFTYFYFPLGSLGFFCALKKLTSRSWYLLLLSKLQEESTKHFHDFENCKKRNLCSLVTQNLIEIDSVCWFDQIQKFRKQLGNPCLKYCSE